MGANAQTSVPAFVSGQVLTAQQQTWINTGIPVFATTTTRDAAFGGTGEKVLAEGQFAYIEASNTTQYYDGTSWLALAGKISQIASAAKTDTFTTTSATYVDITGLSISITPSATSSKILVLFKAMASNATASEGGYVRLVRDSTAIFVGDAASNRTPVTSQFWISNTYIAEDVSGVYLDSPASTSALTYKLQTRLASSGTVCINRPGNDADASYTGRGASSITVMEILA